MDAGVNNFRSCIIETIPKSGRKIWPFLYLDFKLIQLGLKKSLLFDYADVTINDLEALLSAINIRCKDDSVAKDLAVMQAGGDKFIFHCSVFFEYLQDVEKTYFLQNSDEFSGRSGMIVDISASLACPKELQNKEDVDKLQNVIEEAKHKLFEIKGGGSYRHVFLSESNEVSWCTIYGIFLNYPFVYWLRTEESNLMGVNLINYQIKITESHLFGIKVPNSYIVLSFTVPESIVSSCGKTIVANWFSHVTEILDGSCLSRGSISFHQEKKSIFQTSL